MFSLLSSSFVQDEKERSKSLSRQVRRMWLPCGTECTCPKYHFLVPHHIFMYNMACADIVLPAWQNGTQTRHLYEEVLSYFSLVCGKDFVIILAPGIRRQQQARTKQKLTLGPLIQATRLPRPPSATSRAVLHTCTTATGR